MKRHLALVLIAALPFYATAAESPAGKPSAGPMAHADMDKQMTGMQDHMKRMQQQMDRIRQAKDPKERQKLMQEHMQAMQAHMKMMRAMGGGMMMSMMGGKQQGAGPGMGGEPNRRMDMMDQRMDMMQMMMEQMMQHDKMATPPSAR
jgi:Xaa-Pro aminopeptidase